MNTKPKLYFTCVRSDTQNYPYSYHHLEFRVWEFAPSMWRDKDYIDRSDSCPQFTVTFQSDDERGKTEWYAFSPKVTDGRPFSESARLALRFIRPIDEFCITPQMVLDRLEKMNATFVIYDSRQSQYFPPDHILPADYHAYRDVQPNTPNCTVGCMARDDYEARRLITIRFANSNYDKEFKAWVETDRPVTRLTSSWSTAPTITNPTALINWE